MATDLTPWVYHVNPGHELSEHWMGASGPAIAGIPTGANQKVKPFVLGGGLTITETPPGSGNWVISIGGPTPVSDDIIFNDPKGIIWKNEAGNQRWKLSNDPASSNDSLSFRDLLAGTTYLQFQPPTSNPGLVFVPSALHAGSFSSVNHALFGYKNSATEWPLVLRQDNATGNIAQFLGPSGQLRYNLTAGGNSLQTSNPFTQSNWDSTFNAFEIGAAGNAIWAQNNSAGNAWFTANATYIAGNWIRPYNAASCALGVGGGIDPGYFRVLSAASGAAAGTISWATAIAIQKDKTVTLQGSGGPWSGTGISFPPTQYGAGDVNSLDDYEEGTWGCTDYTSGAALPGRYGVTYTKIGRMVYLTIGYFQSASSSSGDQFNISGLPFTPVASGWQASAQYGFTGTSVHPEGMTQTGLTVIYGYQAVPTTSFPRSATFSGGVGVNFYALSVAYETNT